jgi:hypothetical protein
MLIVRDSITIEQLKEMSQKMSDSLVKAVVDIENNIMAVDADMHVDEEALLLEEGSLQENLWGINIYPYKSRDEWIEFDSMINLRPSAGNRTRGVEDKNIQEKIRKIVVGLIK